MDRIKGLRQKSNDAFNNLIPFGTDGILVDMLSGLDNEQELKLGGNHSSTITEISDSETTITETYYALDGTTIIYIVETDIVEDQNGSTTINMILKKDGIIKNEKTITIPIDAATMTIGEVLN